MRSVTTICPRQLSCIGASSPTIGARRILALPAASTIFRRGSRPRRRRAETRRDRIRFARHGGSAGNRRRGGGLPDGRREKDAAHSHGHRADKATADHVGSDVRLHLLDFTAIEECDFIFCDTLLAVNLLERCRPRSRFPVRPGDRLNPPGRSKRDIESGLFFQFGREPATKVARNGSSNRYRPAGRGPCSAPRRARSCRAKRAWRYRLRRGWRRACLRALGQSDGRAKQPAADNHEIIVLLHVRFS